ncbi:MAG: hypothetical protein WAK84_09530 [Candidatus Cybelea sp.]
MTFLARYVSAVLLSAAVLAGCAGSNLQAPVIHNSVESSQVPSARSSTPTITSVGTITNRQGQKIVIAGSGFGTMQPYNGDSCCLEFTVTNKKCGNTWQAGMTGELVTLNVTRWTNNRIVIQGFTGEYGQNCWVLHAGDPVTIEVWNAQSQSGPALWQTTVGPLTPTIASVSIITAQQTQKIIIEGSGFGTMQPYNGDSCCLEFTMTNEQCGNTWQAGMNGELVTLNVTRWTNRRIVIQGFTGEYGQNCWVLNAGDPVTIDVWNEQSGSGPAQLQTTVQ